MSNWEEQAVKHKGVVRGYMRRQYGDKAFNKNGTIKEKFLDLAIARAEREHAGRWVKRFTLAKTFKKQANKKAFA